MFEITCSKKKLTQSGQNMKQRGLFVLRVRIVPTRTTVRGCICS